ncbi:carboxypeptidase-like regulatory domain-containing protein [Lutibacter sp. B1]|uniref:carboxypeptidase-like regulatory domain-containing protein n=1 Tax=Lutibacter sp. B1 TaxID=2725996 RepID=UPI0014570118|nr:carboxypeptidase-like regulatory domain-containing protein [Lutibacter sp. B1]NLP58018.1 carboxypeptidase-like regulatory domain-containing protein [Lutibacter sp. B1]
MIKQLTSICKKPLATSVLLLIFFIGFQNHNYASNKILNDTLKFNRYKGSVLDSKSKKPLIFASLTINGTNISTVTNTQGEFLLKVPKKYANNRVTVSFLGYTSKVISLLDLTKNKNIIKLETYIEELSEVNINIKDAKLLITEVLKRKGKNYLDFPTDMTAFYRETIKKRRTYVSLAEAVVEINKQPYISGKNDFLKLYKARKSTDYNKLDTIALKLRGGPFSMLHLDLIKNEPDFLDSDLMNDYIFTFDTSTKIDNRPIYVVNFKPKPEITEPLYYGKLYIDAKSLALTSAKFKLNIEDRVKASKIFILKKPRQAEVWPIETFYQVDYRTKDGKWYYGYSRIELGFKINWDKRWFNSVYYSTSEMAITNWEKNTTKSFIKPKERLKSSIILSDEAEGFSDPEFWGEYNVIEPEKPIESAIKKIQKQLKKI